MIAKPTDEEAALLDRCLASVSPHVDGVFITQAGPRPNEKMSKVIAKYKGHETFFKWNNSFADARNYSYAQVPKEYEYILWCDSDDIWRGLEKLKATVEENQNIDSFSFWYLYAFDEWKNPIVVHHKTCLTRNDGCVTWEGSLHEDFRKNRTINSKHVEGIERMHLSNEDRFARAKERNLEVSQGQLEENPNDPRSYWNVGNSLSALMKYEEAIEMFNKFLETSRSDDEKYIVRLRMAENYWGLDKKEKAVESLQYAIGMKSLYPDAYIKLGEYYYHMGKYDEALERLKVGITMKPPYTSIIVYNPRDYDFTPLKWMAYTYVALNQPSLAYECFKAMLEITPKDKNLQQLVERMKKESDKAMKVLKKYEKIKDLKGEDLKKALNKIPKEFQSHPYFTSLRHKNFIKQESSGKEISYMCGYTEKEWNPEVAEKEGVGGSEEAVIHLSKRWAEMGYEVTVYNNCGHEAKVYDGVTYKPFWEWNYRDKQDVVILWRSPIMCDYEINADKVFIDLHDVIKEGEFNEKRLSRIDKIFVKTDFHRSLFPNITDDMFAVIPNGIDPEPFKGEHKKDPYLIINTSSPDRSISAFIEGFKKVKEQVPEAKAKWAYGWGIFDIVHGNDQQVMKWKNDIEKQIEETDGLEALGRISHGEVAKLYNEATVFGYPTEFAEIHCISAVKAQAAGAIPVTTDFAALNETVQHGFKIHSDKNKDNWCPPYKHDFSLENNIDKWVDTVVKTLKGEYNVDINNMREWAVDTYDWDKIAKLWINNNQ